MKGKDILEEEAPYAGPRLAESPEQYSSRRVFTREELERKPDVAVTQISGEEIAPSNTPFKEFRRLAQRYALDNLKEDSPYLNNDQGIQIGIGKNGIKAIANKAENIQDLQAMVAIPELIKAGILIREEGDRKSRYEILKVQKFIAPISINNDLYSAIFTVRLVRGEGARYYKHEVESLEIEKADVVIPEAVQFEPTAGSPPALSKISMKDLLRRIKDDYFKPRYSDQVRESLKEKITLKDVREVFKGLDAGLNEDGSIWVRTRRGQGVVIRNVERIDVDRVAFLISRGRMSDSGDLVTGKYQDGVIEISRQGDRWTLRHEQMHWLEDMGILSSADQTILRNHIRRMHRVGAWETANPQDVGGSEDRANYLAEMLENPPAGIVGRIIRRVQDFIDRLVNLVHRTAGGVVRDIATGAIHDQAPSGGRGTGMPLFSTGSVRSKTKAGVTARLKEETGVYTKALGDMLKDTNRFGTLGQIFGTQEWDQTEAGRKLTEAAVTGRDERRHQVFNQVFNYDEERGKRPSEVLTEMRNKDLSRGQRLRGNRPFRAGRRGALTGIPGG